MLVKYLQTSIINYFLQIVNNIQINESSQCDGLSRFYSYFIKDIVESTWKDFLCPVPNNRMACIGDSGGALVCQGFLFGITSHGYNYYPEMGHLNTECGDTRVQTRYLFIVIYRDWINNHLHGTSSTFKFNNLMFILISIVRFFLSI